MDKETLIKGALDLPIVNPVVPDNAIYVKEYLEQSLQGYAIVPEEPSSKMLEAGYNAMLPNAHVDYFTWMDSNTVYKAMLQASKESE